MRSYRLLLWTTFLTWVACGPPPPKELPQLFVSGLLSNNRLGFNQENNSGTFIGASTFNSILLRNDGLQDLTINNVTLTGNRFSRQGPAATTLEFHDATTIEIQFAPDAAQRYSGSLVVETNAENTPTLTVELTGCGVSPSAPDLSYCLKSTDF